jgi:hypothetical protein
MLLGFITFTKQNILQKGLLLTSITTTKEQNHKDYGMEPDVWHGAFFSCPVLQHLNDIFIFIDVYSVLVIPGRQKVAFTFCFNNQWLLKTRKSFSNWGKSGKFQDGSSFHHLISSRSF